MTPLQVLRLDALLWDTGDEAPVAGEVPAARPLAFGEEELALRPEAGSLQRWLDLNG